MAKQSLRGKVAKNIRSLRIELQLTQEKAAEVVGFHYKYYQKIESGTVNLTVDSIEKIAEGFRVQPNVLLS